MTVSSTLLIYWIAIRAEVCQNGVSAVVKKASIRKIGSVFLGPFTDFSA